MDKFLITRRTANPITGPIMGNGRARVSPVPSPALSAKVATRQQRASVTPSTAALGGYVWTLLDRTAVGRAILNGTRVYGFDELLYLSARSRPDRCGATTSAGDLPATIAATIDRAALARHRRRCKTTVGADSLSRTTT